MSIMSHFDQLQFYPCYSTKFHIFHPKQQLPKYYNDTWYTYAPLRLHVPYTLSGQGVTTEMRSFLGLAGYYRQFVKGFSVIASLLTKLLRKGVKFEWDDKCQSSFEQLKKILIEAPVLTQLTSGREYAMYSDALKIC